MQEDHFLLGIAQGTAFLDQDDLIKKNEDNYYKIIEPVIFRNTPVKFF